MSSAHPNAGDLELFLRKETGNLSTRTSMWGFFCDIPFLNALLEAGRHQARSDKMHFRRCGPPS